MQKKWWVKVLWAVGIGIVGGVVWALWSRGAREEACVAQRVSPPAQQTVSGEVMLRRVVFPAEGMALADLQEALSTQKVARMGWHPEGGYEVMAREETLDALEQQGMRVAEAPLPVTPRLWRALHENESVWATLVFATEQRAQSVATRIGGECVKDAVSVELPSDQLLALLQTSTDILASDVQFEATLFNAAMRSSRFLDVDRLQQNDTQLRGEGEVIGVLDSGCSAGLKEWSTAHADLQGQLLRLSPQPWPKEVGTAEDYIGHGTHVVGSIVGNGAMSLNNRFRGVAPGARLFFQNAMKEGDNRLYVPPTLDAVYDEVYRAGGRIHSNSWGATEDNTKQPNPPVYSLVAWASDRYVWKRPEFLPLFAAGNAGHDLNLDGVPDLRSMGSFTTVAKNTLVVGAAESYQVQGVTNDGVQTTTYGEIKTFKDKGIAAARLLADPLAAAPGDKDIRGLALFSDTGPLADGRIKPDVLAPGTQIVSLRYALDKNLSQLYGASTVEYTQYCALSGTSMATPQIAGACAVIRQFCHEVLGKEKPSSALVRALLISGAESIFPGQFGEELPEIASSAPNGHEGFGLASLTRSLTPEEGAPWADEFCYDATTQRDYPLTLKAPASIRATLVWNDYPAAVYAEQTLVNNLDLTLLTSEGEVVAYPNGLSAPDTCNVIERIDADLPAGNYIVRVTAGQVPFDGPNALAAVVIRAPGLPATPTLVHTPMTTVEPEEVTPLSASLLWPQNEGDTLTLEVLSTEATWVPQSTLTLPAQLAGTTITYQLTAPNAKPLGPYVAYVGEPISLRITTDSLHDGTDIPNWLLATPSVNSTLNVVPGQSVTCRAQDTETMVYKLSSYVSVRYCIKGWQLLSGDTVLAQDSGATATFTVPADVESLTLQWSSEEAVYLDAAPGYLFRIR